VGLGLVDLFTKRHGAQADRRDLQVTGAELNFIHKNLRKKQKKSIRLIADTIKKA
jgi:hypothetical protein